MRARNSSNNICFANLLVCVPCKVKCVNMPLRLLKQDLMEIVTDSGPTIKSILGSMEKCGWESNLVDVFHGEYVQGRFVNSKIFIGEWSERQWKTFKTLPGTLWRRSFACLLIMYLHSNKIDLSDISASAPAGGHLGGPGLTLQEQTHRRREIGGWNKFGQIRPLWLKSAEPRPAALTWVLILFRKLTAIQADLQEIDPGWISYAIGWIRV